MYKKALFSLLIFTQGIAFAQTNVYSVLHLNDINGYKFARPKMITERDIFYNDNGTETTKSIKTFDNAGMLLTETRYNNNGVLTARFTCFNDTGKRHISKRVYERWNSFGKSDDVAYYMYDANNFLILQENKTKDGKLYDRTEIKNNEKGMPVELIGFNGEGLPYGKETAEYFYDINKVKTTVVSNSGKILSTDTLAISFRNAALYQDGYSVYNANGDAVAYRNRRINGVFDIYRAEYKYDSHENCTEEKIYKVTLKSNGKKKEKLERVYKRDYVY